MAGEDGTILFEFRSSDARSVSIAGDFTSWERAPVPLRRAAGSDLWQAEVRGLSPGLHAYKLIVDDRWIPDPRCRLARDDGFGGQNSVLLAGAWGPRPARSIRVGSLNLHTYQERDPLAKLEQIALVYAAHGVDLLILQEVGEHVSDPSRPNAGELLRGHLERGTGRPWFHAWRQAHIGFDVYREGVSLLSTAPLRDEACLPLSSGPLARIALAATTLIDGVCLRAVSIHTTWLPGGEPEVAALRASLDRLPDRGSVATLIAGDFNGGPSSSHVRQLTRAGFLDVGASRGETRPTFFDWPVERIDYQLVAPSPGARPPGVTRFARLFDGEKGLPRVSDHAGLLAEYAW